MRVVAKGGATQITGQLMQGGLPFIFVAIAVRILGTADSGLVRRAVQALAIIGQLGLAGFNYSAMRLQLGLPHLRCLTIVRDGPTTPLSKPLTYGLCDG